jgi:ADP-heptose:LPS heptosyltransferase
MHLLVIRTSAMGDVALTIPVLRAVSKKYPSIKMTMVTRSIFGPFFSSVEGVDLLFPDFKNRHKGLPGMFRLFRDIRSSYNIDHVIDLHSVLRSTLLGFFFRLSGVPVSVIDKGRSEKRALVKGKEKKQLKHSVERYCDVFARAGFPVIPEKGRCIIPSKNESERFPELMGKGNNLNIGVAPYAKHRLKMWPEEKMIRLLKLLSGKYECRFWFFGGSEDREKLAALSLRFPGSVSVVGLFGLEEELALMSRLSLMIAMDSSNMHMAALTGTRVVSIWGGTDPLAGFGAWMEDDSLSVRIPVEELTCRPCTIYGKGKCRRGDFACMNWLTPEIVFDHIGKIKL